MSEHPCCPRCGAPYFTSSLVCSCSYKVRGFTQPTPPASAVEAAEAIAGLEMALKGKIPYRNTPGHIVTIDAKQAEVLRSTLTTLQSEKARLVEALDVVPQVGVDLGNGWVRIPQLTYERLCAALDPKDGSDG